MNSSEALCISNFFWIGARSVYRNDDNVTDMNTIIKSAIICGALFEFSGERELKIDKSTFDNELLDEFDIDEQVGVSAHPGYD
jgi:hypothetical protein